MMQPKRSKFRKQFKGRIAGSAQRGNSVAFGEYGLKATDRCRMTAREIEAARRAISRHVKRGGRIWIRVFPDVPITQKPLEVRMGSGKGNVEYWVARVLPGKVLFEIEGMSEDIAREAFRLASAKLSVSTAFVKRQWRFGHEGAHMKAKDLREKAPAALGEDLLKLRREQFNLRMARATGQAGQAGSICEGPQEHCAGEDGAGSGALARR